MNVESAVRPPLPRRSPGAKKRPGRSPDNGSLRTVDTTAIRPMVDYGLRTVDRLPAGLSAVAPSEGGSLGESGPAAP